MDRALVYSNSDVGSNPTWGSSPFALKRRESEPSQLVLYCLASLNVSQLFNHVFECVHVQHAC